MQIVLKIDGEAKTFTTPFISARKLRNTMEIGEKFTENITMETLDEIVDYIVDIFGNQFTRDQLYDGMASKNLIDTALRCISEVTGDLNINLQEINEIEKNE